MEFLFCYGEVAIFIAPRLISVPFCGHATVYDSSVEGNIICEADITINKTDGDGIYTITVTGSSTAGYSANIIEITPSGSMI